MTDHEEDREEDVVPPPPPVAEEDEEPPFYGGEEADASDPYEEEDIEPVRGKGRSGGMTMRKKKSVLLFGGALALAMATGAAVFVAKPTILEDLMSLAEGAAGGSEVLSPGGGVAPRSGQGGATVSPSPKAGKPGEEDDAWALPAAEEDVSSGDDRTRLMADDLLTLKAENERLLVQLDMYVSPDVHRKVKDELSWAKEENEALVKRVGALQEEIDSLKRLPAKDIDGGSGDRVAALLRDKEALQAKVDALTRELDAMKAKRKGERSRSGSGGNSRSERGAKRRGFSFARLELDVLGLSPRGVVVRRRSTGKIIYLMPGDRLKGGVRLISIDVFRRMMKTTGGEVSIPLG